MKSRFEDLDQAMALIIAATKTRKRPVSIAEVCAAIKFAESELSSLNILANKVGLSAKMLRQFMMYDKLSEKAKSLTRSRKIDSVDAVAHIARLELNDQDCVVEKLATGTWDTSDIRAYVEIRTSKPGSKTEELIAQVDDSKTIQQFVFEFVKRQGINEETIYEKLSKYIDREEIIEISLLGSRGRLILSKVGRDSLKQVASKKGVPLQDIIAYLLFLQ